MPSIYHAEERGTARAKPWVFQEEAGTGGKRRKRVRRFATEAEAESFRDAGGFLNADLMAAIPTGPMIPFEIVEKPKTLADLKAAAKETERKRKTRRLRGGKHKTVRDKRQRVYALARAGGVCEYSGVAYAYGLDIHHVRTDEQCEQYGILWDSAQNVIAIRPDWHRAAHNDEHVALNMAMRIDQIEHRTFWSSEDVAFMHAIQPPAQHHADSA